MTTSHITTRKMSASYVRKMDAASQPGPACEVICRNHRDWVEATTRTTYRNRALAALEVPRMKRAGWREIELVEVLE